VAIQEFKGKTLVGLREFYEKDGKTMPGKTGISLTLEQFGTLLAAVDGIKVALKEQGIDFIPEVGDDDDDEEQSKNNSDAAKDDDEVDDDE
jgi:hypothetical protein